jgi:hypothetical protein
MDQDSHSPPDDIPAEEERLFAWVAQSLAAAAAEKPAGKAARRSQAYDAELMALRDEIGEARLEDVPALIAQMERLQEACNTFWWIPARPTSRTCACASAWLAGAKWSGTYSLAAPPSPIRARILP